MFNVTVISLKDIGKYIIKTVIVFVILFVGYSYIKKVPQISYSFLNCLDLSIPGMKQIEWKKDESSLLHKILDIDLAMLNNVTSVEINENEEVKNISEVPEVAQTEVIKTNVQERYTNSYAGVNIKNETDFGLTEEMLSQEAVIENPKRVLIYHTHTCESYTPSESYSYEMTGNYRTTDLNYNVARVGTELTNILQNKGYFVIHDTTYHDFPAYSGSYDRAYQTIENILASTEKTDILIDLHRDSIGDSSYAPTVKIGEEYAAQLMFVIGTNGGGLEHPNWIQNLRTAIQIQKKANEKYPGLFKPIILRNSRYNQNLGNGACIIEVGATGNTMEQCLTSMKYFAEVLDEAFN